MAAPAPRTSGPRPGRLRGRVRRRPLLAGVLVLAIVSGALIVAAGARPGVEVLNSVPVERGYVGTTYAFDGLVCVGSQVTSTRVAGATEGSSGDVQTRLVLPPEGAPPTVGFPVDPAEQRSATDYRVPAGEAQCGLRLLVTPGRTGSVSAQTVRLQLRYGPGGVLRRTVEVRPSVTIDVTGTGTDPRSSP